MLIDTKFTLTPNENENAPAVIIPANSELLHRPRINDILEKAVSHPLVSVLAGPGYGKTQALSRFVLTLSHRHIWMNITDFDNLTDQFWNTFIEATAKDLPELSKKLSRMDFPQRPQSIDTAARLIAQEAKENEKVVLVVDDYSSITNAQVKAFFTHLIECEFKNLSIIFSCSERAEIFSGPATRRNFYTVSSEDLCFTYQETCEIFLQNGIDNRDIMKSVYVSTEGWPVAVNLMMRKFKSHQGMYYDSTSVNLTPINELFEINYFRNYKPVHRSLLVKLALIEGFSFDMLRYVLDEDLDEARNMIRKNIFLTFDAAKHLYIPQLMYRKFLLQNKFLLSDDEITDFYNSAGRWFAENGYLVEAVDCYSNAKNFYMMFETFQLFPHKRLKKDMADFYLSHLERFDQSCFEALPAAEHLLASLYLNNFEVDRAKEIFLHLQKKLESDIAKWGEGAVDTETLGEVYLSLGEICIIRCQACFYDFFEKAGRYLPNGSSIRGTGLMYVDNNSFLFFDSLEQGSGQKIEQLFLKITPSIKKTLNGCGEGVAYLYAAELAYNNYHFQKTQEMAYKAIYIAEDVEHDVYCNAYFLLARLALAQGDGEKALDAVRQITSYIDDRGLTELYDMRDCVESYFYIKMEDLAHVASWMREGIDLNIPPISVGRDQTIRTLYLFAAERYYEALALLAQLRTTSDSLNLSSGLWIEILYRRLYRAVILHRIGEKERAMDAFYEAYETAYGNNLVTIFIEAGSATRALIENVKKSDRYQFDEKWLDNVYQKASTYAKRLATVRSKYREKTNQKSESAIRLTKREMEVLKSMAQGLTREQIADFLGISINGVKIHIRGIYNKLGAINRSDAIYIATQRGILH